MTKYYLDNMRDALTLSEATVPKVKNMHNDEFISHLMNYSKAGPMAQMVIIHAIDSYITAVTKNPLVVKDLPGIINKESWVKTCKILKKEIDEKYNPPILVKTLK